MIPREAKEGKKLWADPEELFAKFLKRKAEYKCWAEHVGTKSGFKHYHCYIRFKTSYPRVDLVRTFGENVRFMNGDDFANAAYIAETERGGNNTFQEEGIKKTKEQQNAGAHVRKLIEDGLPLFEIIGQYPEYHSFINQNKWVLGQYQEYHNRKRFRADYKAPGELFEWQRHVLRRLEGKPHPRHIHWYMDTEGDIGKSELADLLETQHDAIEWSPLGDDKEASQRLYSETKGIPPSIIVCDIEKEAAKDISWVTIERAKSGKCKTGRYNCPGYKGKRPHIVMFTNDSSARCTLTKNRLVTHIVKNKKVMRSYIDGKEWHTDDEEVSADAGDQ